MSGEYETLNNDDLHGDKRIPKYNADLTFFSDADPNLIKNWRPLTLLNCDYKIASKEMPKNQKFLG